MSVLTKEEVKEKLLSFIRKMEADAYTNIEDGFAYMLEMYDGDFEFDLDAAAETLLKVFENTQNLEAVRENMYDSKPKYYGVLLCEGVNRFGNTGGLSMLNEAKHADYAGMVPDEVYEWGSLALNNSAFTNLLSRNIVISERELNKQGGLVNMDCTYCESTYLLITNHFEFIPVRSVEIYLPLQDGNMFTLFKRFYFDEDFCPYEDGPESLFQDIFDLESM